MPWLLQDIAWEKFDRSKISPRLVSLAKAASLVESNAKDYARYLNEVFFDDAEFQCLSIQWAREEEQHGQALKRWAMLADPAFDFEKSFEIFTSGYQLPVNVVASVRGSRCGELIARCVVEIGTSSYYTALKHYSDEPVFQQICGKIAADEFRHYKLFYDLLNRYAQKEKLSLWQRLRIVIGRIVESEDDELAYAYYAAHNTKMDRPPYEHERFKRCYLADAYPIYRCENIEKMVAMVCKAVGIQPRETVNRCLSKCAWLWMQRRARAYAV